MAKPVTVKTFLDQPEAYIAPALLEQHGITTFLFDQNFVAVNWFNLFAVSGLRLMVVGFRPGDRGDIIVVKVQKRAAPSVRYPPEVYL